MDLIRVRKESLSPKLYLPQRVIRINPTFHEAISYIHECLTCKTVGFDIEVDMNTKKLTHLGFAQDPLDTMSIPLVKGIGNDYFSYKEEVEILQLTANFLFNTHVCKVMQNAIFDSGYMFHEYGMITNNIQDTMIGSAILTPDFPKNLAFIVSIYTREPYFKDMYKQGKITKGADK